jgi:ribonuclease VapC
VIVDASALVAIIRNEPDSAIYAVALEKASSARISAANYFEAAIVIDGSRDPILSRRLDDVLADAGIAIEAVTERHARLAREAYRDFGKGTGHPAQLNFGDCFAYALARETGEPLLFKGNDFRRTDIRPAI